MKWIIRVVAVLTLTALAAGGAVVVRRGVAGGRAQAVATASPRQTPVPAVTADPGSTAKPAPSMPPKQVLGVEHDMSTAAGKTIELDIAKQKLIAWEDGVVVYRFVVSTGRRGFSTPTGTFKIHTKYVKRWSRKWKVWMPYAMFWHPRHGYAFHELPYKPGREDQRIGKSRLGRPDSHGCVRVDVGDAKTLYDWAPVGTTVWIH